MSHAWAEFFARREKHSRGGTLAGLIYGLIESSGSVSRFPFVNRAITQCLGGLNVAPAGGRLDSRSDLQIWRHQMENEIRNFLAFVENAERQLPECESTIYKRRCLSEAVFLLRKCLDDVKNPSFDRQKVESAIARSVFLAGQGGAYGAPGEKPQKH